MLENSIDKKSSIIVNNETIIDLTESCLKEKKSDNVIFTIRRVPYNMIMRMDLVSKAQYDTDEYADLLLKYNDISNPFTLNFNDILYIPSMETIANDVKVPEEVKKDNIAELVRNYHKFIDKEKLPATVGSEKNELKIEKNYTEANLSDVDESPIVMRNGRIYFSPNSNVDCSTNGITASDFTIQKIENIL